MVEQNPCCLFQSFLLLYHDWCLSSQPHWCYCLKDDDEYTQTQSFVSLSSSLKPAHWVVCTSSDFIAPLPDKWGDEQRKEHGGFEESANGGNLDSIAYAAAHKLRSCWEGLRPCTRYKVVTFCSNVELPLAKRNNSEILTFKHLTLNFCLLSHLWYSHLKVDQRGNDGG